VYFLEGFGRLLWTYPPPLPGTMPQISQSTEPLFLSARSHRPHYTTLVLRACSPVFPFDGSFFQRPQAALRTSFITHEMVRVLFHFSVAWLGLQSLGFRLVLGPSRLTFCVFEVFFFPCARFSEHPPSDSWLNCAPRPASFVSGCRESPLLRCSRQCPQTAVSVPRPSSRQPALQ